MLINSLKISKLRSLANQQPLLQNESFSPFWEIKVLLVETNFAVIRMVEKVLEQTTVTHFLRRIDNIHDLNFELRYNKPDVIICGRTMGEFNSFDVLTQKNLYAPSMPVLVLAPDFNAPMNIRLVNEGAYDIVYHNEIKRLPKEISFLYKNAMQDIA